MQYSLRHGLTKRAVSNLLNVVGLHVPSSSTVTQYKLKKYFLDMYEDITFKVHYCCSSCHSALETADAACLNGCVEPVVDFLTISLKAQLKRKLSDPTFWSHLQKRFTKQDSGNIEDVMNGREYQKHQDFLSEPGNISLMINTDDVSMFKSANISLWPIWVAINELPPHIRFQKRNLMLAGVWFGEVKPMMTTFLAPFLTEANALSTTGFSVHTPDGREITARARVLMCSVDLPAKAMVLNTKQFNGQYGCNHCEDEGVLRTSSHLHRNWPYSTVSIPRSHDSILSNAKDALENGKAVKGVKGASTLSAHEHFNLGTGMVIDVMHCVYLGVMVKTLMTLWLGVSRRAAPFSIRSKVTKCDEKLMQIRVPHDFSCTPMSLANVKTWKASEHRSWILYYSLPVLHGLLPNPYFAHYALLVAAIHILVSTGVCHTLWLEPLTLLLRIWLNPSFVILGDDACTMNVHLLKHLTECVHNWGPLWGYSCFSSESMNGHLKQHFHGTRSMNAQLAFAYVMLRVLPRAPSGRKESKLLTLPDCHVMGSLDPVTLDPDVQAAVYSGHNISANTGSRFWRAVVDK